MAHGQETGHQHTQNSLASLHWGCRSQGCLVPLVIENSGAISAGVLQEFVASRNVNLPEDMFQQNVAECRFGRH